MRNPVNLTEKQLELVTLAYKQQGYRGYASQRRQVTALTRHGLAVGLGDTRQFRLGWPFQLTPKGLALAASHLANKEAP